MKIQELRKTLQRINKCTPTQKKTKIHGIHYRVNGERVFPNKKLNLDFVDGRVCEVV